MTKKRSYTFREYARDMKDNIIGMPAFIGAVTGPGHVDEAFREKIMLSISRMNECRHCMAIHGKFAELAGLSEEDRAALQDLSPENFDHREWVALEYARRFVSDEDNAPDAELESELKKLYSDKEIRAVEAVARGINLANRCGNTWDAFLDRLKGEPSESSTLKDELLILTTLLPVGPFFQIFSYAVRNK